MTSQQERPNRHLMRVSDTDTWPLGTEGLPGKIHPRRIDKCPGDVPRKSDSTEHQPRTTRWKFHGEMNIHDLSSGSTYSSRRSKIAKVKKTQKSGG